VAQHYISCFTVIILSKLKLYFCNVDITYECLHEIVEMKMPTCAREFIINI